MQNISKLRIISDQVERPPPVEDALGHYARTGNRRDIRRQIHEIRVATELGQASESRLGYVKYVINLRPGYYSRGREGHYNYG
jgi:hypothetical protein